MLNELLPALTPYVPFILVGLAVFGLLRAFWPDPPPPPSGPVTCPRCGGRGEVDYTDPKTFTTMPMPCSACRGIGAVKAFKAFKRHDIRPCEICEATGFIDDIGPLYPDGSPQPGAKAVIVRCDGCQGMGWLDHGERMEAANIEPIDRYDPPEEEVVPADMMADMLALEPEEPSAPPPDALPPDDFDEEVFDDDGEMPPVDAPPSMFGDEPPKSS